MEGSTGKLDRCNDRKICGKSSMYVTVETPVTSTCLSVDCLELKTDRMLNKPLYIESAARHKHHMQMMEHRYIWKEIMSSNLGSNLVPSSLEYRERKALGVLAKANEDTSFDIMGFHCFRVVLHCALVCFIMIVYVDNVHFLLVC
jgi:hypothetical protein